MNTRPLTRAINPALSHAANARRNSAQEEGGASYLDSIVSSVCCELQAGISASYPGSGESWLNITASPNNGESQGDFDCWLGIDGDTDGDEPTFNTDRFELDGGDFFTFKVLPDLFAKMHRSDINGSWIACAFKHPDGAGSNGSYNLYGTGASFGATDEGFRVFTFPDGSFDFRQSPGGDLASVVLGGAGSLVAGNDYLLIISWDGTSTSNNIRYWLNATTKTSASLSFKTATSDGDDIMKIADAGPANSIKMDNGGEIFGFAAGNAFIDDAIAAQIFTYFESLYSIDFTP